MVWFRLSVIAMAACGRLGFAELSSGDAGPPSLTVSVTFDRFVGPPTIASIADLPAGTVGLSLREALAIAANHPGPDRVVFDPHAFPAGSPVTITIASPLVVGDDATTLDASGAGVIVAGASGYAGDLIDVTGNADVIEHLELNGGATGIKAASISGLLVSFATIRSASALAIDVATSTNVTIVDCAIDLPGGNAVRVATSSDVTFQRGHVTLSTKTGVVNGLEIDGSQRVHVLDSFLDPGTAWMVHFLDTTDSEITGNVIVGGDTGIALDGATQRATVFRNVIITPAQDSVYVATTVTDTTVLNNTMYMASSITDVGINTSDKNDLISSTATDFVDPAAYDFHLAAGSPSIDAAIDVGQDMLPNNALRFLGAAPDLGAVESY